MKTKKMDGSTRHTDRHNWKKKHIRLYRLKPLSKKLAQMDHDRYNKTNTKSIVFEACPGTGTIQVPAKYIVLVPPGGSIQSSFLLPHSKDIARKLRKDIECSHRLTRTPRSANETGVIEPFVDDHS